MATKKPKSKAEIKGTPARQGQISEVIGAVVDVQFEPGDQPELFEALEVKTQDGRTVVLEVEGAIGDNVVRCIAMDATDGFRRGDKVAATGAPISVPVGVETQIFQAVLENKASEYAAKMVAMQNATTAAGDLVQSLTLYANKVRQAGITTELMEIVSGAAAQQASS